MQNFRKIQWIVIENFPDARTHGRTRVNSKVPIPTKSGDQQGASQGAGHPLIAKPGAACCQAAKPLKNLNWSKPMLAKHQQLCDYALWRLSGQVST